MPDDVQLTDLDVITRYSIAVRSATADRSELIEVLRADLNWLERNQIRPRPIPEIEPDPGAEPDASIHVEVEAVAPQPATAKKRPPAKTAAKRAAARGAGR